MKKCLKVILCIIGAIALIILIFWLCLHYELNYKKTVCDTAISPDEKYQITLMAIGEPNWPFGSASGRLILKEGKNWISQIDFELWNDGGNISSGCWKVTWYEDYVEVILSGDEQFDEQIILYFDGKKESKQLTDKEECIEAEDMSEIEEINSQTAYAGEPESQEDMELDENDANSDDDSDLIKKINKYMIPEQSFDVTLDDWGEVKFVSCRPTSCDFEASFYLIRDEQILYKFPYMCEDNKRYYTGCFDSMEAVAFRDINDDGKEDIIIIFNYVSGAGPTGMVPRPGIRIFLAGENEFYLAEEIMEDVEQNILSKDMTIEIICNYLKDNN